jgi:hypothetical protein
MIHVFRSLWGMGLLAGLPSFISAADNTRTGQINDSMCGASHQKMTSAHVGMTDRDCVLGCVKGVWKYVFGGDGKVYKIANRQFALLQVDAGYLTGDMKGDTITVSNIAMGREQ